MSSIVDQGCDGGVWQVLGEPKPLTSQGSWKNLKRAVINIETGEQFDSVNDAIEVSGVSKAQMYRILRGARPGPWKRVKGLTQ